MFTTGVTSSGKTYTVLVRAGAGPWLSCRRISTLATHSFSLSPSQGNASEPGLLPRSLDVIFNSVGDNLCDRALHRAFGVPFCLASVAAAPLTPVPCVLNNQPPPRCRQRHSPLALQ